MPSKRSRKWHQRKLVEQAASRLSGDYVRTYTATNVEVTINGQLLDTSFKEFTTSPTSQPDPRADQVDALVYAMAEAMKVKEAAARLDGTHVKPPVSWTRNNFDDWGFDKLMPHKDSPFRTPRLDGRRWKK